MVLALAFLPIFQAAQASAPADLPKLLALYRHFDLPFPPESAPLAYFMPKEDEFPRHAGYYLEQTNTYEATFVQGTSIMQVPHEKGSPFEYVPTAGGTLPVLYEHFGPIFPESDALITAIIEESRGHHAFAQEILGKSRSEDWTYYPHATPDDVPSRETRLAWVALNHWKNSLLRPNTDRSVIADRIATVLHDCPRFDTPENEGLIQDARLAVTPPNYGWPSDEELIDRLTDETTDVDNSMFTPDDYERHAKDSVVYEIAGHGFEIIPTLIAHLHDHRLTRSGQHQHMMASPFIFRVCDLCNEILQCYRGQSDGWALGYSKSGTADFTAWWQEIRSQDERQFAVSHLEEDPQDGIRGILITLLEKRYPDSLAEVYKVRLSKNLDTSPLLDAIVRWDTSKEAKAALLLEGAGKTDFSEKYTALRGLQQVAPEVFDREMIRLFDQMPDSEDSLDWDGAKVGYARLIDDNKSPLVWKSLTDAAQRGNLNLKAELIIAFRYSVNAPNCTPFLMQFLGQFFEDSEVIPDSATEGKDLIGIPKDLRVDRLAVTLAARALRLTELNGRSTDSDWEQLKQVVRSKIALLRAQTQTYSFRKIGTTPSILNPETRRAS
jgi:hypothetical protein